MLRLPKLTLDSHFKLEDFQHDFNYIIESLKAVSKSAKDFGITGVEADDNTDKIQDLIALRGNIYFPEGDYTLTKLINVYSDTTITLHPNAKFIRKHEASMFQTANTEETIGYAGERNIKFNGGTYKHDGDEDASNIFSIFHSNDVTFNEVVCLNVVGAHAIDIVGSKNIRVLNCVFKGYKAVVDAPNKEAIQIDAAGCFSYPIYANQEAKCYDGTPTINVIIDGCEFGASDEYPAFPTAVGQHGQLALNGGRYKNIRITNNLMYGDVSYPVSHGIRAISWENGIIENNIIEGYRCGIFLDLYDSVLTPNGVKIRGEEGSMPTVSDEDTLFMGCRNITITNNTISSGISGSPRVGVWANIAGVVLTASGANCPKHRWLIVAGNIITMPSPSLKTTAIEFDTTEDVSIVGNTIINNAKADSIAVGALDYCKNIIIGKNAYKNITRENECISTDNSVNIRKQGVTTLWTGKAVTAETKMILSDSVMNYDEFIIEVKAFSDERVITDLKESFQISMRFQNLADNATSSYFGMAEMNILKTGDREITLKLNKKQEMADKATAWSNIAVDYANHYIKAIYGVNH